MSKVEEQYEVIEEELRSIRAQIDQLRIQESLLVRICLKLAGDLNKNTAPSKKQIIDVKTLVLNVFGDNPERGLSSAEVEKSVRIVAPEIGRSTVGAVLSRLKAEGVLRYSEGLFSKA